MFPQVLHSTKVGAVSFILIYCRRRVLAFDVLNLGTAIENAPQSPVFEPLSIAFLKDGFRYLRNRLFKITCLKRPCLCSLPKTTFCVNIPRAPSCFSFQKEMSQNKNPHPPYLKEDADKHHELTHNRGSFPEKKCFSGKEPDFLQIGTQDYERNL